MVDKTNVAIESKWMWDTMEANDVFKEKAGHIVSIPGIAIKNKMSHLAKTNNNHKNGIDT